jgi:hypothetical protein
VLSVGPCIAVPLVWHTVSLIRHVGLYSEFAADFFVVVRGGSRGSVPRYGSAQRSFAYRHGHVSLTGVRRHTPGMVYPLHLSRYFGHYRDSDAEIPSPKTVCGELSSDAR